ncbi:MAG TPA: GNAT family N-acetyltransferase [Candidatus Polarisedimenticolaceae bacterium]|nr:GNAT family N-acetyltransferase [Candidatus Polarisedimenticolaceae bacterium]
MSVHHDPKTRQFQLPTEQGEARLSYRVVDAETLDFSSTYVEPGQRGRGLAAEVVRAGLDYARAEGKRVIPSCSYVRAYLRRHPEYGDLER